MIDSVVVLVRVDASRSSRKPYGLCPRELGLFRAQVPVPCSKSTIAIGSSDGVSECRCRCAVGQRKTSQSCVSGNVLFQGSLVQQRVFVVPLAKC